MSPDNLKSGDTDDLEALFDEIAEQKVWETDSVDTDEEPKVTAQAETPSQEPVQAEASKSPSAQLVKAHSDDPHDVFQRVGLLTRKLHDALRELGYDKSVEAAVSGLPDARARLTYIANLTGEAANKVLASVEKCQVINDDISARAQKMDQAWERLFNNDMSLEEFKAHAKEAHEFTKAVRDQSGILGSEFTEIMMAQDFHDLTGQVVNRIATMAQNLEEQLVQLLLDTTPAEQRKQVEEQWLTGPAINAEGRTDVCSDQSQVDDLLESLGF